MRETLRDVGLLGLRAGLAVLMIAGHGWPKLAKYGELTTKFSDPLGVGSHLSLVLALGAEIGCSVLLLLGLFTRLSVLPLAFTMAMAAFVIHADDPWRTKEMAVLYLVPFLALALTGPGRFSLDAVLSAKKLRGWQ